MQKSKDINIIMDNFQEWANDRLNQYAGRDYHWVLRKLGGFCPYYLAKDFGFGVGILPMYHEGGTPENDIPALGLQAKSYNLESCFDSRIWPFPLGAYVIQQIKDEIVEFIEVLLKNGKLDNIIEIGLGQYGGTHILWSQFFNSVTTIDNIQDLIDIFKHNNRGDKYKDILINNTIIYGISYNFDLSLLPQKSYDCLFIDADHTYQAVRADHEKYAPIVRSGGIVGFHDTNDKRCGVPTYMDELRKQFDIKNIWHPEGTCGGISYYIKL